MKNLINNFDGLSFVLGTITSVLLVTCELRKTRKIEIYYKTFDLLLRSLNQVETIFNEINYELLEFHSVTDKISESDLKKGILEFPLGEDIYIMDYFNKMYDFMNEKLRAVDLIMQQITFQSAGFKKQSKSEQLLLGLNEDISNHIQENYSRLLEYLRKVRMDKVIFLEDMPDFLPTRTKLIDGKKTKVIFFHNLSLHIDNLDEIMHHFNKNNFN